MTPRTLRILHVIASLAPRYGGPSVAAPAMAAALAERGHDVELFTTDLDGEGRLDVPVGVPQLNAGFRTTYFRVTRPREFATSFALARELRRRIRDFDVVHVHSLYLFHGLVACALARRAGVPYVVRPHGTLNPYHRSIRPGRKAVYTWLVEQRNLERAAAVHCTSVEEAAHVERLFPRARPVVVPLGVAPILHTSPGGAGDRERCVTFLGRLTEKKRPDLLVEAFGRIARELDDVRLVIAGPDDERLGERLAGLAVRLGVADRVSFPGLLDREASRRLLSQSDVFVLPSEDENFGVAVAEAMAAGVPVVLTDGLAGHANIAARGAGIVAEASPHALAEAMAAVLSDFDLAARMGANGRALAAELFDWSDVTARLEAVYLEAVA